MWFVGPTARKLNAGEGKGKNFGYDDDKGRYKCVKNDHVSYRFEVRCISLLALLNSTHGDLLSYLVGLRCVAIPDNDLILACS